MSRRKLTPEEVEARKEQKRVAAAAWYRAFKEQASETARARYLKNPKGITARTNAYRKANPEKSRAYTAKWRSMNRGKKAAALRAYQLANPAKCAAYCAKRRSRKKNQLHPTADPVKIAFIYERAATLSRLTGWQHAVDHIIPLIAGGFHHEDNLQALPIEINSSKNGNPFWEHDEYCSWKDVPRNLWPVELVPEYTKLLAA
jgi:hypothetical protein